MKLDSWKNILTGLGTSRDKVTHTEFSSGPDLSDQTLEQLYHNDDIAARVCDLVPDEMLRQGFDIQVGHSGLDPESRAKYSNGTTAKPDKTSCSGSRVKHGIVSFKYVIRCTKKNGRRPKLEPNATGVSGRRGIGFLQPPSSWHSSPIFETFG